MGRGRTIFWYRSGFLFSFCEISVRGTVLHLCTSSHFKTAARNFWSAHVRSTESVEIMMLMPESLDTYIQEILLHHCVEDDGDEEIEDDGGTVLPSVMVKCHLSL